MRKFFVTLLLILSALVLIGCGTTKQIAVVDHVKQDTIYLSKIQYDSIFINQYHAIDRSSDTIFIEDVKVEYRYKLLRDTTYIHHTDSIPVIKEVEVTREVRYIPWWSKALNWIGAIALVLFFIFLTIKIISWKISI